MREHHVSYPRDGAASRDRDAAYLLELAAQFELVGRHAEGASLVIDRRDERLQQVDAVQQRQGCAGRAQIPAPEAIEE